MPRHARVFVPGVVYHLISRFVDREWFIENESERSLYIDLFGRAISDSDWRCLAYGIMSNHVHHAVLAGATPLDWIRRVHSPFVGAMNMARGRIGVMFVRGPKAIATAPERVAGLLAYIHNNPVRAGVVANPSASTWTSHGQYLGIRPAPAWLRVDEGLALSGFHDRSQFDRWVADPERRDSEDIVRDCHVAFGALDARPRRRHLTSIDPLAVVAATAEELCLPVAQVRSRRRGVAERFARGVAIHCGAKLGLTGSAIADAIGVSQQRVSVIQRTSPGEFEDVCDRVIRRLALSSDTGCARALSK